MLKSRGKDLSIKLNYGSLYSVVAALEKHGFIEAVETLRDGNRPERTVYDITEAGRLEFQDWLTELLGTPEKEFSQLEAGLVYLPAFPPDRVVELLDQRITALEAEIAEVEGAHASMVPPRLLGRVRAPARVAEDAGRLRSPTGEGDPLGRARRQCVLAQGLRAGGDAGDQDRRPVQGSGQVLRGGVHLDAGIPSGRKVGPPEAE